MVAMATQVKDPDSALHVLLSLDRRGSAVQFEDKDGHKYGN